MKRFHSSAYLSSRKPRHPPELFRTAQLNVVGWAAVAGLCAVGATAGLAAARVTGTAPWIAVPAGGAAALAGLVAADRRKWRAMPTTYAWTDDVNSIQHIADVLTRAGVAVTVEVDDFDQPKLQYLNRDHRQIRRTFRNAGLPPPPKN